MPGESTWRKHLAKFLTKYFFVEAHKQRLSDSQCGCAQIAGRTQHRCHRVLTDATLNIKLADFFAFHGNQLAR